MPIFAFIQTTRASTIFLRIEIQSQNREIIWWYYIQPIKSHSFEPIRNKPARYKFVCNVTLVLSAISRYRTWHVQSKLLVNQLEEKLHANSSPQRQLVRALQPPVESRNLIVTGLVQSLFVRSVVTRNPPSCLSESCPSSVLCEKSLKISRPICVSRAPLWWLFKKLARLTLSVCLKTPTCAPSTPSGSPSCPRTFSWPAESAESEHRVDYIPPKTNGSFRSHHMKKSNDQHGYTRVHVQ